VRQRTLIARILARAADLFPLWVIAGGIVGLVHPSWVTWFHGELIVWGLAAIMLGMGITLGPDDFRAALAHPRAVGLGVVAQYGIMPLLGWIVAGALGLETPLAVGLILVASCPGGTASNVVTYLARGDVALSILMTAASTAGAVVMTPLLTTWLAGRYVPVDGWALLVSTAQVVLLPVVAGVGLNAFFPRAVRVVLPVAPLVSVFFITLIVASIIGERGDDVRAAAGRLLAAVLLLHGGGFGLGYLFSKVTGHPRRVNRTVSIEVGMQNSGLAVVLARLHFASPLTALPAALSAMVHCVLGSGLAAVWRVRR
jgi:BASS family bile acid:Na+ symporter